jgi:hypothetical protein
MRVLLPDPTTRESQCYGDSILEIQILPLPESHKRLCEAVSPNSQRLKSG